MKKTTYTALRAGVAVQALSAIGAGLAGALLATPALAQDFTYVTASGRVVDANDKPIPNANVEITSNDQGFVRTVTTDGNGSYRVPTLPQGSYTFTVSADGFATFSDANVTLTQSSGGNSFRLVPESASQAANDQGIVVVGARIKVSDFDRATTGAVIPVAELASRVPVARDLTSIVMLTPGATQGDSAFGNLAGVSGSSVSENAFFVNGLNITDFREGLGAVEVPFEFYRTIEVKSGGIPAEFGRFTGGFVNAVTKSGSNQFHGGMLFNWIPDSLKEDAPNTLIEQNDQDTGETIQAIVNLSGPIIKDRVFFYGFYQMNSIKTGDTLLTTNPNTLVSGVAVPPYSTGLRREVRKNQSPYYGGKIDIIPFDGHRLEGTYFNSSFDRTLQSFGIVDTTGGGYDSRVDVGGPRVGKYQSTALIQGGGENFVGRYTGELTSYLTVSAAYGQNKRRSIIGSTTPDDPFVSDISGNFSPALSGNAINLIQTNLDKREFYRGDVELYVNAFGEHHFKAGYDRENLTTVSNDAYTGNVAWTYNNSGPSGDVYVTTPNTLYVTGRTRTVGGTFTSRNEAFYLQDAWSLLNDRLTLNLGVRNDRFTNNTASGANYYKSGDQWAPRLSFTFDPFGDKRTKVYGSFGRYFLPIVANTNIRLAGAELDYTTYNLVTGVNPNGSPILGAPVLGFADAVKCPNSSTANCDVVSDGTAADPSALVSQSLKPQSVDEFVFGVEQQLGERIRVGLFGQYRKLNESLEDIAIDKAVNDYCTANHLVGCSSIWTGFHQYVLANPGSDARIQLQELIPGETKYRTVDFTAAQLGYPKARRTYKAITATFDREFDGTWGLNASYTWSRSRGNIEGGIRSDNSQTDSGLTTAFDQPGLTNGTYGPLPGDATHQIKVFGSYAPTSWLTLGIQSQAVSPRKFGCIGRVPLMIDAFAGAYGAAGFYCNVDASGKVITDPAFAFTNTATATTLKLTPRGSVLKSDWTIFTNVSAIVKVPTDLVKATFRVDVFNVFNRHGVTDLRELGTQTNGRPRGDYGTPLGYQTPRYFRFQFGVEF